MDALKLKQLQRVTSQNGIVAVKRDDLAKIVPMMVAAFQGNPDRDIGHKLETTVYLQLRRRSKELFYSANGADVDICSEDGAESWNICWSLTDAVTIRREQASIQ